MNGRGEWVENGRNKESYRNLLWIGTRVVSEIDYLISMVLSLVVYMA